MALSKLLPVGSTVKLQVARNLAVVLTAEVVGLCRGGGVIVKDLMGVGTEAVINLVHFNWSPGKSEKNPPKESAKITVGGWLLDRKSREVVVALAGLKDPLRGILVDVFEDTDLGACIVLRVGETETVYQWSNLLFVRRRVSATPSNKPTTDKPAAVKPTKANPTAKPDDAELEFEVGPSASMIGSSGGGDDELGLATEAEKKP